MKFLAIFALQLTLTLASAFNLLGLGNDTLLQRLLMPVLQEKEAEPYSRITNGLTAATNQFPYQVGLRIWSRHIPVICGGSLISNEWVLTAAHCTIKADTVYVHMGSKEFEEPQTVFNIAGHNIIEHNDYNTKTDDNDISLIRIPAILFSDAIASVRLPRRLDNPPSHIGELALLAGWGLTSTGATRTSPTLQYFPFPIISNERCATIYAPEIIGTERLCTPAPHRISGCNGDSGGALVLLREKVQIGILSFGGRNCEAGLPMVFTRVDSYLNWISEHTHLSV